MPENKLSLLAIVLGAVYVAPNVYGFLRPAAFGAALRKFPRNLPAGFVLMLLGTAWFIYNVSVERNSDFERMKDKMMIGFAVIGIGSCFFVQDFLAVRGLAVGLLLLAKLMVDTERWHDSQWRLVIAVWAYAMIVIGIWFTVSPWRCRDWIHWNTANEQRLRKLSALRVAFGAFVLVLGLTAFRVG